MPFDAYLEKSKKSKEGPVSWHWGELRELLGAGPHFERGSIALTASEASGEPIIAPGISASFQVVLPSSGTSAHKHSFWHLYIVYDGEGTAWFDDDEPGVALARGDILFVPPWCDHAFRAGEEVALTMLALQNLPELSNKGLLLRSNGKNSIEAVYADGAKPLAETLVSAPNSIRTATSKWSSIPLEKPDPIYGLAEAFAKDENPARVNLAVGVYQDAEGKIPLLKCVKNARELVMQERAHHGYLPIEGLPAFTDRIKGFFFGDRVADIGPNRFCTLQTPGGSAALSLGAAFLAKVAGLGGGVGSKRVWISDPTWANHRNIFESAGFSVATYPYYDREGSRLSFEDMIASLSACERDDVVLLHSCCHNPTGDDLSLDQWRILSKLLKERGAIAFIDMAYQGFGQGLEGDAAPLSILAEDNPRLLIAHSFAKSMSLYGERLGSLTVLAETAEESEKVLSNLKRLVRSLWSSPPAFGALVAEKILSSNELYGDWVEELGAMRQRIRDMRGALVEELHQQSNSTDFSFLKDQQGMFSLTGITSEQVRLLRSHHHIYMVEDSRTCFAALNPQNVKVVGAAIADVLN